MAAKNKGLGKGLGTLLGDVADLNRLTDVSPITEEDIKSEQLIRVRLIEPNRNQPRRDFDQESLSELAESIRVHGVIAPLILVKRGERYMIIAGERRWRAAKLAGLKEVPAIVKDYSEREIAEIALIENSQRKDLNPVEEAMAFKTLIEEYDLTQDELAERVSKNRTVITNALRLLKLPEEVLELLVNGALTTGHAKAILSVSDPARQTALAREAAEKQLSVREVEERVRREGKPAPAKNRKKALKNAVAYRDAENSLKEKLGTRVSIARKTENSGKIEIDYYSLDDLERILSHIR
jgi:ParB family chromosome partitioning protein